MDWILILPRNTAPQRNSLKLLNGKSYHIISTTIMHNNATWAVAVYFWNLHVGQDESWYVIVYQSTLEDSPGHTSPGSQVMLPGSSSKHPAFCASHMATALRPGLYIEHLYKCVARPWEPREPLLEAKGMNHDSKLRRSNTASWIYKWLVKICQDRCFLCFLLRRSWRGPPPGSIRSLVRTGAAQHGIYGLSTGSSGRSCDIAIFESAAVCAAWTRCASSVTSSMAMTLLI